MQALVQETSGWSRRSVAVALSVLALVSASRADAAPKTKKIGFSVQVMTTGLTKTTVAKIAILKVQPDSQALDAGIVVGDELVKIDNIDVPGNSVFVLKGHMAFEPGVPKTITFKRVNGTRFDAIFVRALGQ